MGDAIAEEIALLYNSVERVDDGEVRDVATGL